LTVGDLDAALARTDDLRERVDLYNRFYAHNRDDSPLDVLDRMEEALSLSHHSAYTRGIFQVLVHRAYCYHLLSEKLRAEDDIRRLKQLHRDDPLWERENMYYFQLLSLYYSDKKYPGLCSDYTLRCLTLARKLSDHRISASAQAALGRMNFRLGQYDEAESCYFDALNIIREDESVFLPAMINCHLGELYASGGSPTKARRFYHRGYDTVKRMFPRSRGYAWVLRKFAAFEEGAGNLATAEYLYGEAVLFLEKNGYTGQAAEFRMGLGRLMLNRGDEEGVEILTAQLASLREKGLDEEALAIRDLLAAYHLERGDYRKASHELAEARTLTGALLTARKGTGADSYEQERWMTARENLTRVHSLGRRLAACQSREEIFLVLREALVFLDEDDGLLVAEELSDSVLVLIHGRINGVAVSPREFPHDPESSMISYCLRNNQSLLIDDFEEEKGFFVSQPARHLVLDGDYPSSLSLMNLVYRRESVRGVISLQSTRRGAFRFDQLEFLQSLLPFVTVALDNVEKTGMIRKLSVMDSLTGLINRREFMRVLENSWNAHVRSGESLSLIMVDIDHFKSINDTYGHQAGDEGLTLLARTMEKHFKRATDACGRYGGEEFIILSGYTDEAVCRNKAEELRRDVEELSFPWEGERVSFTVSLGTASHTPREGGSMEDLIKMADSSLYQAKRNGRNRVVSHDRKPQAVPG